MMSLLQFFLRCRQFSVLITWPGEDLNTGGLNFFFTRQQHFLPAQHALPCFQCIPHSPKFSFLWVCSWVGTAHLPLGFYCTDISPKERFSCDVHAPFSLTPHIPILWLWVLILFLPIQLFNYLTHDSTYFWRKKRKAQFFLLASYYYYGGKTSNSEETSGWMWTGRAWGFGGGGEALPGTPAASPWLHACLQASAWWANTGLQKWQHTRFRHILWRPCFSWCHTPTP